jgi:hypothetical protein
MVKMNQVKTVQVEAKTLRLHMKVRDEFQAGIEDQDGNNIGEYEGYVPEFMPGAHYGDYLILDIDLDTGQILNWKTPTACDLEATFGKQEDE